MTQRNDLKKILDKDYRLSTFWHIKDKNQNLIKFKPNRAQEHFRKNKHSRNIICKSRQLGFSTYEALDMLDDVCFNRNFDAIMIAQDLETSKDIFDNKIGLAWNHFKLSPLYKLNMDTARQMKLDFGDKTVSSITVDNP